MPNSAPVAVFSTWKRWSVLTIFAEAAQLLETLAGVQVGTETLRTHAEAAGTELEGEQRAAIAHVQATQEPPPGYAPVVETLLVETDGVMARYRDHHLDGTLIKGEWHEIKLGLVGGWQDGQLVSSSYVAARETASSFAPRPCACGLASRTRKAPSEPSTMPGELLRSQTGLNGGCNSCPPEL